MRCTHTNLVFRKISSVTVRCPRATTASRLVADTPISRDIFCGDLTAVVETKDVEKTWNLVRRLAAVSSAGLVHKDRRSILAICGQNCGSITDGRARKSI